MQPCQGRRWGISADSGVCGGPGARKSVACLWDEEKRVAGYIRELLQITPTLSDLKQPLLSHSFFGSGIQVRLSWGVCFRPLAGRCPGVSSGAVVI